MNELISVIIPIYNMEKYLKKCVWSVINQSYKNIEILLIDDGSKDNSPQICDEFLQIDERIKVFHKKNGGLSDAKNYGIKKATGDYITFVDADDWIESNMYEEMLLKMKKENADISICGRYIDYENGRSIKWNNPNEIKMNKEEALIYLNSFYKFDMASWDKIYKKELFNGIEFPYGKKCEDAYTTYLLFAKCKKIIYIPECFYHYFQRKGSISRNAEINMDYIYAAAEQMKYIEKFFPSISYVGKTNYAFAIKSTYQVSIERKIKLNEEYKQLKKDAKKYTMDVIRNKYISVKKKITFILFSYFSGLYSLLLKFKYLIKR